jgi:hypothetical protein
MILQDVEGAIGLLRLQDVPGDRVGAQVRQLDSRDIVLLAPEGQGA